MSCVFISCKFMLHKGKAQISLLYKVCYRIVKDLLRIQQKRIWLFLRKDMFSAGLNVPGWGGFVSVTGSNPI